MTKEARQQIAEEVTRQVLQSIKSEVIPAVKESIQTHVNGKIDKLHEKMDAHVKKMEPIYEVYDTATNVGNFTVWISKVFLAIGAIIASIAGVAKLLK